jgi:hypothetical protein
MMMAYDSSPGHGELAPETIEAVRAALALYVVTPLPGDELRSTLCALSAEARKKAILPEQLLVLLKEIWYSLPTAQAMTEPAEQTRLLQRIVTMCIKEYYSSGTS